MSNRHYKGFHTGRFASLPPLMNVRLSPGAGLYRHLVAPDILTYNRYDGLQQGHHSPQTTHKYNDTFKSPAMLPPAGHAVKRGSTVQPSGYSPMHHGQASTIAPFMEQFGEQLTKSKRKRLRKKKKKLVSIDSGPDEPVSCCSVRSSTSEEYFTCDSEPPTIDLDDTMTKSSDTENLPIPPSQQTPTNEYVQLTQTPQQDVTLISPGQSCNRSSFVAKSCGSNQETHPDPYVPNIQQPTAQSVPRSVKRQLLHEFSSQNVDCETDSEEDNHLLHTSGKKFHTCNSGIRSGSFHDPKHRQMKTQDEKISNVLNHSCKKHVNDSCGKKNMMNAVQTPGSSDVDISCCDMSSPIHTDAWRSRCSDSKRGMDSSRCMPGTQIQPNRSALGFDLPGMSMKNNKNITGHHSRVSLNHLQTISSTEIPVAVDKNNNSVRYTDRKTASSAVPAPNVPCHLSCMPDDSIFDECIGNKELAESWSMQSIHWDDPSDQGMDFEQLSEAAQAFQASTIHAMTEISNTLVCAHDKYEIKREMGEDGALSYQELHVRKEGKTKENQAMKTTKQQLPLTYVTDTPLTKSNEGKPDDVFVLPIHLQPATTPILSQHAKKLKIPQENFFSGEFKLIKTPSPKIHPVRDLCRNKNKTEAVRLETSCDKHKPIGTVRPHFLKSPETYSANAQMAPVCESNKTCGKGNSSSTLSGQSTSPCLSSRLVAECELDLEMLHREVYSRVLAMHNNHMTSQQDDNSSDAIKREAEALVEEICAARREMAYTVANNLLRLLDVINQNSLQTVHMVQSTSENLIQRFWQ